VFGLPVRGDILARVVNWQLAKRRAGTHKTKGISDISGTTKKPYKQKGTGRAARAACVRRNSAAARGSSARSCAAMNSDLQKKVRKLGAQDRAVGEAGRGQAHRYRRGHGRRAQDQGAARPIRSAGLGVGADHRRRRGRRGLRRAARNLPKVDVLPQQGANVYDILRRDTLVLTRDAVEQLEARLK
jgi:large subunit ribosomal protein L4